MILILLFQKSQTFCVLTKTTSLLIMVSVILLDVFPQRAILVFPFSLSWCFHFMFINLLAYLQANV